MRKASPCPAAPTAGSRGSGAAEVIQEAVVDTARFEGDYPDGGVSRLRLIDGAAA